MVSNTVYHFAGSNLKVEIFLKKRKQKRCVEIENSGTSVRFVLGFQENSMQSVAAFFFLFFLGNKKNFKGSVFFHSLIIEFLVFA